MQNLHYKKCQAEKILRDSYPGRSSVKDRTGSDGTGQDRIGYPSIPPWDQVHGTGTLPTKPLVWGQSIVGWIIVLSF
jgi:hypothetical protein